MFNSVGSTTAGGYLVVDGGGQTIIRLLIFVGTTTNWEFLFVSATSFVATIAKNGTPMSHTFTNYLFYSKVEYPYCSLTIWSGQTNKKLQLYKSDTEPVNPV